MIRLKTHIGSKHKPGDIVGDDKLDAKLTARLIAEGRAERVRLSDQTAEALRRAIFNLTASVRLSLANFDRALRTSSPEELEGMLDDVRGGHLADMTGEGFQSLHEAIEAARDDHRQALAQDAADEAAAAHAKGGSEDAPPAKGGKTNTGETSSGTARKASRPESSGTVEGKASRATPKKAKAGGRQAGKPEAGKGQASAASGEPTDQKRSGAEAARGTHNPEAGGSNPPSAPSSSAAADPGSDVPAIPGQGRGQAVPGGQSPSQDAKRPDGSSKAETGKA